MAGSIWGAPGCGSGDSDKGDEGYSSAFFPQSVASFDPRPSSVVLWSRVIDAALPDADLDVTLEVATDERFTALVTFDGKPSLALTAEADWDYTVRARIDALEPETTYYYRFSYAASSGIARSRVGRTRTAPPADADVAQRFAVICCQDYGAGYYHALRGLHDEALDFVLHLGDYVYETTPASLPQGTRGVRFGRPEDALELDNGALAARSLDNYRDLYRTYRADPDLQRLHERFPMLCIWDDHEFSDDSHGATGTYFAGRKDETDLDRRAAADQAWFEYIGVDFSAPPAASFDAARAFPDNLTIYRDFSFGRHLSLVLTDLRRYRPDHLVPENALPGAVFLGADELEDVDPAALVPYVDIETFSGGVYADALRGAASALDLDPESLRGNVSVPWINSLLPALTEGDVPDAIAESEELPRGYAYHQLLKTSQFSRVGSRYVLAEAPFSALARARYEKSDGADQQLMGAAQRSWFLATMAGARGTFKVWANEVAFMARRLDLSAASSLPEELRTRIIISAEDWDGFPDEREALLVELAKLQNVVILSGDLHCFLAGTPFSAADPRVRVVELLTSSVTSTTWREAIAEVLATDPSIPPSAAAVASSVGALLQDAATKPNPHLAFQDLGRNGCSLVNVSADAMIVEFRALDPKDVRQAPAQLSGDLAARIKTERFRIPAGNYGLERQIDGGFVPWDAMAAAWQKP